MKTKRKTKKPTLNSTQKIGQGLKSRNTLNSLVEDKRPKDVTNEPKFKNLFKKYKPKADLTGYNELLVEVDNVTIDLQNSINNTQNHFEKVVANSDSKIEALVTHTELLQKEVTSLKFCVVAVVAMLALLGGMVVGGLL